MLARLTALPGAELLAATCPTRGRAALLAGLVVARLVSTALLGVLPLSTFLATLHPGPALPALLTAWLSVAGRPLLSAAGTALLSVTAVLGRSLSMVSSAGPVLIPLAAVYLLPATALHSSLVTALRTTLLVATLALLSVHLSLLALLPVPATLVAALVAPLRPPLAP